MIKRNINIRETIKEHFFVNPESKLRVREIEKKLNLPLPSVIRYSKELEHQRILALIKMGNAVFYTANRGNEMFLKEKMLHNLKSLYSSKLIDYLKTELSNPSLIVFGSYSKGEDTEQSDIDLYIETPSKKEINLQEFEKKLGRKIQIFRQKSLSEIKNAHLANNILNGIKLNGFIEVFK